MGEKSFNDESGNVDLNNIQFSDIFVLEEIQQFQDMFSNATGVASVITNPDGIPITKPSNFCKLCNDIIRGTEKGRLNCFRSDIALARQNTTGPVIRTCFSGDLWDAGASITVGGKHIANWLIGQVRNENANLQHMLMYADEIGVEKEVYCKALNEIPEMSFDRFCNVANMLFQFANGLSEKAYSNLLLKNQIIENEQVTSMLLKSEEKYRLLVENCHDIIFTIDNEGFFTFVSPVWTTVLGFPVEQVIGRSFREYVYEEDASSFLKFFIDLKKKKACIYNYEYRIRHQDGTWRWHTTGGLPIKNTKGEVTGYYGAARDITNQREAEEEIRLKNEELLKANAVKDKFFSIIAHDLRSPFCSILGLSKMLSEDTSDFSMDQVQHIAESIHDTAENLFRLLENLLQWAKVQQKRLELNLDNVVLFSVVMDTLVLFKESMRSKDITMQVFVPENMLVYADTNILQTILRNLISNAVKFTPKGGKIEVSACKKTDGWVEISVKDTGIGMSKDLMRNLFRPDVQTNRRGTEDEPSTGLGLLLCKEFVEKSGGHIYIESEHNKGSRFYFTLPDPTLWEKIFVSE